ncbi:MAG: hypothetical protein IPP08_09860 [Chlorobiota bacterium]|nr:hypothetical protein [Chlorobiota bacterium]QQS66066.1 MAG: hypothetical protein IPP08_09860 [Chlorobiota bacterium]
MKFIIFTIIFLSSFNYLFSQDDLFVEIGAGFNGSDNSVFSNRLSSFQPRDLNNKPILYRSAAFSNTGLSLQATSTVSFGNLILNATLSNVYFPKVFSINEYNSNRSEYKLSNFELGIAFGYPIVRNSGFILFPFIQGSLTRYNLSFNNNNLLPIPFFEGDNVLPGEIANYTANGPRASIGLAFDKVLSNSEIGLIIGSRITFGKMLSSAQWEQNNSLVKNGGNSPCNCGATITLNFGYGKINK